MQGAARRCADKHHGLATEGRRNLEWTFRCRPSRSAIEALAGPKTEAIGKAGAAWQPDPGCHAYAFENDGGELLGMQRNGAVGFGDEIDRTHLKCLEGLVGAVLGERRDHHHGAGMLQHDAVEAGKAIHLGHLDIERDDVGPERADHGQRLFAVASRGDLETAFGFEQAPQKLPHQGGIVDDEHAGHEDGASALAGSN